MQKSFKVFFAAISALGSSQIGAQESGKPNESKARSYASIVLADEPIGYWDFSEKGTKKPVGHDGSLIRGAIAGKVTLGHLGPRPATFPLFAEENQAADFPGAKDFVRVEDPGDRSPIDFDLGDSLTLEAWVFPRSLGNGKYAVIVGKGRTGNPGFESENQNYAMRLKGADSHALVNFLFRSRSADGNGPQGYHRWTSKIGFPVDSGWHHVAITYTFGKVGSLRAYVDGKQVDGSWDMEGDTDRPPVVDNDELWIGSGGTNHASPFLGWIDEVAIYRKIVSPDAFAARFRRIEEPAKPWPSARDLPEDRVLVSVFDGLPDRTWGFTLGQPQFEYSIPSMAMTQVPKKYNERGIIEDRKLPILTQWTMKRTLPAGKYSFLIRSKNGTRFWIDEKLIHTQGFINSRGDGHEQVPTLPEPLFEGMHPLPQGHREDIVEVDLTYGVHRFRLDAMVGGKGFRPELGEACVAIANDGNEFHLLTPEASDPWLLDEHHWKRFLKEEGERFTELNRSARIASSGKENDYWRARHELAKRTIEGDALSRNLFERSVDHWFSFDRSQEIDDYAFLRRLSLDTVGVVPSMTELDDFINDPSPTKRSGKIEQLLRDDRWADHWVGYWQDVLAENPGIVKPELNNTGPFRWWIYEAFLDNKPIDRMATELSLMEGSKFYGGTAGFAMATQNDAPMAAKAQILAKAFLAMEMSCARCHDSPNSPFKQEELFSLAAMLQRAALPIPESSTVPPNPSGRKPLVTVSMKAGDQALPRWHLEALPKIELPDELIRNGDDSRERFALMMTSPTNKRFARVIANRLWQRYLGWAIIEPVDHWNSDEEHRSELLDFLAVQLIANGYDLKHLARLIFHSKVYQAAPWSESQIETARKSAAMPGGPARRRMTAEQIVDSLLAVTGKPMDVEAMTLDPEGRRPPEQFLHLGNPTRAWQFASTSTDRDRPALIMPAVQQVSDILIAFGWRDARPAPLTIRDESSSPLQSLIMGNGLTATRLARLSDDHAITSYAWNATTLEGLAVLLYQTILSRPPTVEEKELVVQLLADGFETRRIQPSEKKSGKVSYKRNAVSWANHLVPEATRIKLLLEQEILEGDAPTPRLENDWRERAEDITWALLNSPEFLFLP